MRVWTIGDPASCGARRHRVRAAISTFAVGFLATVGLAIICGDSRASNETYTYDNAGRLITVDHGDGRTTTYTLDPAGNRSALQTTEPAAPPTTLAVPTSSSTGSYSVSWPASASPGVTAYKLWESTSSNYAGETIAYTGASPAAISGRATGTYYYRVQACVGTPCGSFRVAGNAIVVTVPPGAPASITVPATSSTGSYTISWTAPSSGTVTGYELYESTSSSFSTQTQVYSGASLSAPLTGRTNGTYYYRVRACNGATCGTYTAGANGIVVSTSTIPSVPSNIRKTPTSGTGGSFSILWDASTGTVNHYTLEETETAPGSGVTTYTVTGTSKSFSKGNVYLELSYRVRACATSNESQCSAYSGSVFKLVCPSTGCE